MNKYLADSQNKVLRGPVTIEEPYRPHPAPPDWDISLYINKRRDYEEHIASLPTIKAEWLTDSDNGRLLEEETIGYYEEGTFRRQHSGDPISFQNNLQWLSENQAPIPVKEDGVAKELKVITDALREDKDYYYGWQANIAMAFYDECCRFCKENKKKALNKEAFAEVGNRAAKYFLDLLIRTPSYHHEKFSSTQPNNEGTTPSSGSIGLLNLSDK